MIGDILGKYQVLEEVGQGGMSVVYRGFDTVLKRDVAIKVLHAHLSRRKDSRQRFEREALAIAKLSHPNILQIFDFSDAGSDHSYIVTEFIEGQTLRDFLEENPAEYPEIAAIIGLQLCGALQHAHNLGIIHRDIKPENVMICQDGALKLMDFGIAQIVDSNTMTATGALLGSPAHMSPEMIEGTPLDFRADIFSMGTLLYFAAAGDLPFHGRNPPMVLKAILDGNYLNAEMVNPNIGRRFSKLLDKCLAREPDDRFRNVLELQNSLRNFLIDNEIDPPEQWLQDFFLQPSITRIALRSHLIRILEERGKKALKARRVAAALSSFNRVLAMDPEHEEVLRLIRRIDNQKKVYVYLGAAVLLALAVGGAVWVGNLPSTPDQETKTPPVDLQEATVDAQSSADLLTGSIAEHAKTMAQNIATTPAAIPPKPLEAKNPPPKTPDPPAERLVRFKIAPQGAVLKLNQKKYNAKQAAQGIKLAQNPQKPHTYTVLHNHYLALENHTLAHKELQGSPNTPLTLEHTLNRPKKARIKIAVANDPKARFTLYDQDTNQPLIKGISGTAIAVPIVDKTSPIPRRKVRIEVESEGKNLEPRVETLIAGRPSTFQWTAEAPKEPEAPKDILLSFKLYPPTAVLNLNGKRYNQRQALQGISLPRDKVVRYRITNRNDQFYKPVQKSIGTTALLAHQGDKLTISESLGEFLPAHLVVRVPDDRGALFQVYDAQTNKNLGTQKAGSRIRIPVAIVDKSSPNPRRKVRVKVIPSITSGKPQTLTPTLTAGLTSSFDVEVGSNP